MLEINNRKSGSSVLFNHEEIMATLKAKFES